MTRGAPGDGAQGFLTETHLSSHSQCPELLYKGYSCCYCCLKDNLPQFPLGGRYSHAGTEPIASRQQHLSVGLNSAVSNTAKTLRISKKKCITQVSLRPAISRPSAASPALCSLSPSRRARLLASKSYYALALPFSISQH